MDDKIKVYIKTDAQSHITQIASSVFLTNPTGWTEIDSGTGDKYAHAQNNYFEKPLINMDGTHNYKVVGGAITEVTTL